MLIQMKLTEFLNELKSDSSAPGGGSVSALAGSLGAALALMVGNLTLPLEKYKDAKKEILALQTELEPLLADLEKLVDDDTEAFNQVMQAFRLPKGTDEEKSRRTAAIQQAMKGAAELPYIVAIKSLTVLKLASQMLQIGNTNAASDAAVAGRMAYAAVWGAVYNVRINLTSIKDETFNTKMRKQISDLLAENEKALASLVQIANEKIPE